MPTKILLVLFCLCTSLSCISQSVQVSDHIKKVIHSADREEDNKKKWSLALQVLKWGKETDNPAVTAEAYRLFADIYRPERVPKLFEADSLFAKYASASGSKTLSFDAYRLLATDFLNETLPLKAEKAIAVLDSIVADSGTAYQHCVIHQLRGMAYFKRLKPQLAIEHYKLSIPYAEKANNDILKARGLNQLGFCYSYRPNPDSASMYLFEAISLSKKINNDFEIASGYDMLGFLFRQQGNLPKALEYYEQAIHYYNQSGMPVNAAYTNLVIGEMYIGWKKPETALPFLQQARTQFEKLNYKSGLLFTYTLLGRYYSGQKQKDSSDYYAEKRTRLSSSGNPMFNFFTAGHEAVRNIELGNQKKSDSILSRILPKAKDIFPAELINASVDKATDEGFSKEVKAELKKGFHSGNLGIANWDTMLYNPFTGFPNEYDSIIKNLITANEKLVQGEEALKRKAISDSNTIARQSLDLATKELRIRKLTSQLAIFLAIVAVIIAILIYAGRRRILTEKQDANHRIGNNLKIIDANINDIKDKSSNRNELNLLQEKIFPLNVLYRLLQDKKSGTVYLQDYLGEICDKLLQSYSLGRDIKVYVEAPVYIAGKKATPLGLIVNELVTNSFKHAFPSKSPGVSGGEIKIACTRARRKYCLSFSDNGPGLPVDAASKGTGMESITGLAHQLRATIIQKKEEEGVNFEFYFF